MPRGTGLTDEQIAATLAAIRSGKKRNEVSRLVGIAPASVSKIAAEHGLNFDRTATAVATTAKKVDAAALRAELELDYLRDAIRLRSLLWAEQEYAQPVGSESGPQVVRWTMDTPVPNDKLKLMQASTIASNASQRIADARGETGVEEARSMLVNLAGALGHAWRQIQSEDQPSQETP